MGITTNKICTKKSNKLQFVAYSNLKRLKIHQTFHHTILNHRLSKTTSLILYVLISAFLFSNFVHAQDFPDKILGYKVHKAKIAVKTEKSTKTEKDGLEAFVKIGEPELEDVSLTGITFELPAEIDSFEQSGTVDFLTFHDFRVNGLAIEVEEYRDSFEFKKNEPIDLPKPFKIFISTGQSLIGAAKELSDSKEEWRVTGRVFVFGQFKRSIFKFKRVVPVEIDIKIKNPLKEMADDKK